MSDPNEPNEPNELDELEDSSVRQGLTPEQWWHRWSKLQVEPLRGLRLVYWWCRWRLYHWFHDLLSWWHCFRFGMLPLGQWVQVESVRVCGVQHLGMDGPIPAFVFAPGMPTHNLGIPVAVAQSIEVDVRNTGPKPVRLQCAARLTSRNRLMMVHSFPQPLLEVGKLQTVFVTLNQTARLEAIIIPDYVRKESRKARVARETQQKVEQ